MTNRYSRQSFLGPRSEEILRRTRVGIVGLGGGGSQVAQQLGHLGVGEFVLFDKDVVEDHNLNRLVGATAQDAIDRMLKVGVARRLITGINPAAEVDPIPTEWQGNSDRLRECDVVFGCVDSYGVRDGLERACRRFMIPYLDVGMDVTELNSDFVVSGQVILSMAGQPCMWCLGFLTEDRLKREAERYGAAGSRPQVVWANGALVCAAVGTFVQLVTPWHGRRRPAGYLEYDGNRHTITCSRRLAYVEDRPCPHFPSAAVGDPFWLGCPSA